MGTLPASLKVSLKFLSFISGRTLNLGGFYIDVSCVDKITALLYLRFDDIYKSFDENGSFYLLHFIIDSLLLFFEVLKGSLSIRHLISNLELHVL